MATLLSESGTIVEKRPYFSFNMSLVLTNYKDNVFVVDGAPITPINDIKDTNVKTAIHTEITKQLPIKIKADKSMRNMETALKEKEKKNKKQSLHISDGTKPTSSRPWGTYNTSAGTTATPTSTTTLYYNTNS